jgi:glutathione S-transferase
MITIYGVYRSRATRPLWVLHELGLEFTHVPVIQAYRLSDPGAEGAPLNTMSPAFLAIHSLAQIPVMVEDGLVLTESMAIATYIARRHGGQLGPQGEVEAAQTMQWALFAATAIEGPALEIMRAPASEEGEEVVRRAAEQLRRPLAWLEQHLAGRAFMVGERFTVADVNAAECLRYAQGHATLLAEFPAVKRWLEGCQARPAFQAMWARRLAEPA